MQSTVMIGLWGIVVVGVGATAFMDLWALIQKKCLDIPSLDYRLVGRWIGHFPKGRFVHDAIAKAEPVPAEALLGWSVHYAIGILCSAVLVLIWGMDWLRHPTLLPALIVGLGSIAAPFFIMQPGFGAGVAASRTLRPWLARFRSAVAHASFSIGLYLSGLAFSLLTAA